LSLTDDRLKKIANSIVIRFYEGTWTTIIACQLGIFSVFLSTLFTDILQFNRKIVFQVFLRELGQNQFNDAQLTLMHMAEQVFDLTKLLAGRLEDFR
jgi:hypothetical protein